MAASKSKSKPQSEVETNQPSVVDILDQFRNDFASEKPEDLSIQEYLEICKTDSRAYATSSERMLNAIGEPEMVDTSKNPRLSRIFNNRKLPLYKSFESFYGMEKAVEQIVSFFKHAAQGLEESKQILYLLGPVGGGKSSLAEHLKSLMEKEPIYVLTYNEPGKNTEVCPYFVTPLCLFSKPAQKQTLTSAYNIPSRYLNSVAGPWVNKRLAECSGDISKFAVRKLYPNISNQVGIAKTEPGDENNQDISDLVGKVDIRKLKMFSQNDPDAYSFSGSLCRSNQGMMEFVEMFKAPIKVLHPLLTATQEGNYNGTEAIGAIPFKGTILAHSNESEWETFRNNKNNEAFLDRVYIVKVPYCLRVTEEVKIYEKMLKGSSLSTAPCAPYTMKMLAEFMVMTRLKPTPFSSEAVKMRVYDGESLKDRDVSAKPIDEYREQAGMDEGMNGWSTRSAFKILARVFNYDSEEQEANPVHLLHILQQTIDENQLGDDESSKLKNLLKNVLQQEYMDNVGKEIQTAYLESYSDYGQNLFERYIMYADHWMNDNDYRDPDTGTLLKRSDLEEELVKTEAPFGVSNPKDFRHEMVNLNLRYQAKHGGESARWDTFEKMKEVIQKRMFSSTEDLLPIISFSAKGNTEDQSKHNDFVNRMISQGYTRKSVRLLVDWYLRVSKSS
jgi:serine protein kinase